ncbi:MAG: Methionyl-tRNA formyltransferase [Dehalococcoidia bacterium]|nr:Methionyl-tRNA formyltransferase [Dehalococcoidia bacterium]
MRLVYMGTPAFAIPPLEELLAGGYEVVGVYAQPDKPAGRGMGMEASPVKVFAQGRGLKVLQPTSLRASVAHQELLSLGPDLMVVAAYGRILPKEVLQIPRWGCVNLHPSLLPRHRGPSPVAYALLEGDETTGVTLILLDEGMDTGPVIAQQEEPVLPQDTAETLTDRLFYRAATLLVRSLPLYFRGELEPQPQDETRASYTSKLTKEEGAIRWELPAVSLWRQVRAYSPWPGSYTRWRGKLLKVMEAVPLPWAEPGSLGMVVSLESSAMVPVGVITGEGVLGLKRVQLEGKQAVDATDFLRGHQGFVGSTLPS